MVESINKLEKKYQESFDILKDDYEGLIEDLKAQGGSGSDELTKCLVEEINGLVGTGGNFGRRRRSTRSSGYGRRVKKRGPGRPPKNSRRY